MTIEWDSLHLEYDPFKARIGGWIRRSPLLRRLFYAALGSLFLREKYVKRELRRIASSNVVIKDIWDAGSGYGQYTWFCARLFPLASILGVDVKEDQVGDCRHFFRKMRVDRCRFEVGDLAESSYDAQFDLILSVDVMEHIPDDVAVFRNFYRSLRPGGLGVINTPTRDPGAPAGDDRISSVVAEHVREGYSAEEIQQKLSEAGFVVQKVIFTYGSNGARAWRLLQGHPMRWLHWSNWLMVILPLYYVIVYPIALFWMHRDLASDNQRGGGILVVATRT